MYLEPWQVFLGGCVIGTLIAFIVLFVIIMNTINRIGIRGIHFQPTSDGQHYEEDDDDIDTLAKLSWVLLRRGCITDDDMEFLMDELTFEEWRHVVEQENKEPEKEDHDKQ